MCGIVGIWSKTYNRDRLSGDLDKAVASLRHRGPDDNGVWMNGAGLGLGHTRLSILDLSSLGHQPMISVDNRHVIVFNGEIYNFREIRKELERAGHLFSGSGDTEVILHAFREWGSDAVKRFIGMFAIALWDETEQVLQLFRDRVGVKPLYFGWDGNNFCFGSELKALRALRHWNPEIDRQSLGEYFQYGYVPDNRSIYKGIYKLRPGHRLTLKCGRQPIIEKYWSVTDVIGDTVSGSDRDIQAELEELLIDACSYRMVSDVPVGIYLSGGIDSSLVTALLAKHYDQSIQTFTIGFSEESHDESRWARRIAEHCGTSHTEYILDSREAVTIARNWGNLFDEPFADSSSLASQKVKVVLSADGGDELFSGYTAYATVLDRVHKLDRVPSWCQYLAKSSLSLVPKSITDPLAFGGSSQSAAPGSLIHRIQQLQAMLDTPMPSGLIDYVMSNWKPDQVDRLLEGYSRPTISENQYPGDAATQISLRDFHHYLPGDILTKVDRTTMAVSIEGREPLLDHRLAEFAFRLPPHLRRGTLGPKHILKSILYKHVPPGLVNRPKQGFAIPKVSWLQSDLRELAEDYLAPERIRQAGILNSELVARIKNGFYSGDSRLAEHLWSVLVFEMWRERWG
jgi:asparagine synthase (glutamine-hydrolysing)